MGFSDVGELLSRNPRLLSVSLDALQEKHAFLTSEWGQTLEQLARFPQAYTYSLSYLRTRHGYLKVAGREGRWHLHRALRTADYLFAKKLGARRAPLSRRVAAPRFCCRIATPPRAAAPPRRRTARDATLRRARVISGGATR